MVGRMRGESVVLTAEKGKLKLRVDGKEAEVGKEVIYDLPKKAILPEAFMEKEKESEANPGVEIGDARCDGPVQGGAVGVDGEPEALGGVPGTGPEVDDVHPLAEAGHGGDVAGADAPGAIGSGERVAAQASSHAGASGALC